MNISQKDITIKSGIGDHAGDATAVMAGALGGATAAGTIAAAAGATTIPILTSLGSLIGATITIATPVGWVIGSAGLAALGAYGISRFVKRTGKNIGWREKTLRDNTLQQIMELEASNAATISNLDKSEIRELLNMLSVKCDQRHIDSLWDSFISGKRSKDDTIKMAKILLGEDIDEAKFNEHATLELMIHSSILFAKSIVFIDGNESRKEVNALIKSISDYFSASQDYIFTLYNEAPIAKITPGLVNELRNATSPEFMKYLHQFLTDISNADGVIAESESKFISMISKLTSSNF
jgi:uncharacterized tellurite resistance protein B-like protein